MYPQSLPNVREFKKKSRKLSDWDEHASILILKKCQTFFPVLCDTNDLTHCPHFYTFESLQKIDTTKEDASVDILNP